MDDDPSVPSLSLSLRDVEGILSRREYRPGWDLTAYAGQTRRGPMVRIHAWVDDPYRPGQATELDIYAPVPEPALDDELSFDKWMLWRLVEVERHEAAEWYRRPSIKGTGRMVPVFNPHRDGADRDVWPVVKLR